jgi:hypothetical protein
MMVRQNVRWGISSRKKVALKARVIAGSQGENAFRHKRKNKR